MIRLMISLLSRFGAERGSNLLRVGGLTLALIAYSSAGFLYFEIGERPDLKWGDAIWYAIVTMTTVGYGDLFPTTVGGRYLVGVPTMFFGVAVIGYLLSVVATFLIEAKSKKKHGFTEALVDQHILVLHYPSLDRIQALVSEIRADPLTHDAPIVLVDAKLEALPDELEALGVHFVSGDPTHESTLEQASFRTARHAVVLAADANDPLSDNHTLAAALTLEHLRPEIFTVAECVEPERIGLLKRAGCDAVVCIAEMATSLLVSEVRDPGLNAVFSSLITATEGGQQIFLVPIQASGTVADVQKLFAQSSCLLLGILHEREVIWNPKPEREVQSGEAAVGLGKERPYEQITFT